MGNEDTGKLSGTLATLGLMPKEGSGYERINKAKLDELKEIGVDSQPFLDALFGGRGLIDTGLKDPDTGKLIQKQKTILGELDNTTTPFEAAQYTFGVVLLLELTSSCHCLINIIL